MTVLAHALRAVPAVAKQAVAEQVERGEATPTRKAPADTREDDSMASAS